MPVALDSIRDLVRRSRALQEELKKANFSPNSIKTLNKRYSVTEAARLVGRTANAVRDAEGRGDLPRPETDPRTGRRLGYTLENINYMRECFGTRPRLNPSEDHPCILAIQNFKGGVAKTTLSVHLAQYFARAGYRVLLVDCDSQASATTLMGYTPDLDLGEEETLYPYFTGEQRTLAYAVRETYWAGLKLIPANLALYGAEYFLAARTRNDQQVRKVYHWLRDGLRTIQQDFDIIILDPPPALGMISLNVMYAANAVVVPMPPSMLDFFSTVQFFTMVEEVLGSIGEQLDYSFIKILVSRKKQQRSEEARRDEDRQRTAQDDVVELARDFYGKYMLYSMIYDSAEIETATAQSKTIYELEGPSASHKTYRRAIDALDAVGAELESLIRDTWPSHRRLIERERARA